MTIGERIKHYRKLIGLSGKDLALKIGISGGNLSEIENNKYKPGADALEALAEKTDINPSWLLTGVGAVRISESYQCATCVAEHPDDPYISSVADMMRVMDDDTKKDIQLSVQKEKLLRELIKERQHKTDE